MNSYLFSSLKDGLVALSAEASGGRLENANSCFFEMKRTIISKQLLFCYDLSLEQNILIRDVLEAGAHLGLLRRNMDDFVSALSLLQPWYYSLCPSGNMYRLLAIEMLRCLVVHDLPSFYETIEAIPHDVLLSNPDIKRSVSLGHCISEGNFRKAIELCQSFPTPECNYLCQILMNSIRTEMAGCFKCAYTSLGLSDAASFLFCKTEDELLEIIQKNAWTVKDGAIVFENITNPKKIAPDEVNHMLACSNRIASSIGNISSFLSGTI